MYGFISFMSGRDPCVWPPINAAVEVRYYAVEAWSSSQPAVTADGWRWDRPHATNLHRRAIFIPVTAVLSNIVSNVPAVMLLRNVVAGFPEPDAGWLALAMASTLAGNLTITGSVANIIVVEQAAAEGVEVRFREYFRIGLPVTALTLAFGTVWLWMSS
jgi:hypothetical protein